MGFPRQEYWCGLPLALSIFLSCRRYYYWFVMVLLVLGSIALCHICCKRFSSVFHLSLNWWFHTEVLLSLMSPPALCVLLKKVCLQPRLQTVLFRAESFFQMPLPQDLATHSLIPQGGQRDLWKSWTRPHHSQVRSTSLTSPVSHTPPSIHSSFLAMPTTLQADSHLTAVAIPCLENPFPGAAQGGSLTFSSAQVSPTQRRLSWLAQPKSNPLCSSLNTTPLK